MRPIFVIAAILLGVGALYWRFPYALDDSNSVQRLIYLVLLLMIIMLGGGRIRQEIRKKAFRDGAIWLGIILLLVFAYSFRDMFSRRITGELLQQQVQENSDGSIEVRASEGGHYFMEARVNDTYVRFLVDTGASDIVLSPKDAERAGIDMNALTFDKSYSTANGFGSGANVVLNKMKVGSYTFSQVAASVNKEQMSESLLGMSFLKQFKTFRIEDNRLVLIP
jgi:aspartyl protease family protein